MKTACLIVIGHVDHGKTALVHALTGIETDRLEQEKQRGLSITLGFAHCDLGGLALDLIDAPGHEDFTRAMVSGATGAQGAVLVVSAPDGIEPQTVEHLTIARLLGVPVIGVAVTKADLVAPEQMQQRITSLRAVLSESGLGEVPFFPCSALEADGLALLKDGLAQRIPHLPPAIAPQAAFLPIDRVFSLPGAGTIATGTLLGAGLTVEDAVTLHPSGRQVRIRGLQSRGADRKRVEPGGRTAVNLRGVAAEDLARGDVLVVGNSFAASHCLDIHLTLLPDAARPIGHMQELRALFGTTAAAATLRLFGKRRIAPGESGFAQLRFRHPVTGFAGQRILLRGLSPVSTLGGAVILDPLASPTRAGDHARHTVLQAAVTQDEDAIARALCDAGKGAARRVDLTRIARSHVDDLPPDCVSLGEGLFTTASQIETVSDALVRRLEAFHEAHPIRAFAPAAVCRDGAVHPNLSRHVEAGLLMKGALRRVDDRIALASHDPWANLDEAARETIGAIETRLSDAGPRPPDLSDVQGDHADLLDLLVLRGTVVLLRNVALRQTIAFHQDALDHALQDLSRHFPRPERFTTSQARTALNTSRKFIVPLLEHFDSIGATRRIDDARVIAPPETRS